MPSENENSLGVCYMVKESETKLCKLYQKMQTEEWFNKDEEKEMIEFNKISLLSNPIQISVKETSLILPDDRTDAPDRWKYHIPYTVYFSKFLYVRTALRNL